MAHNNTHSLYSTLAGSAFLALILWAVSLAGGILTAMFTTTTGKTTALFGSVFFEVIEGNSGTDFSLGIESVPHTLILLVAIWVIVFALSLALTALWGRTKGANTSK